MANSWVALAVAGSMGVVVAVRSFTLARSRAAGSSRPPLPVGADGIIVGAEPIQLPGEGDRGVLLLHGFNDTPQSIAFLARALHDRGWSVSAPLLPHHGRGPEELARHGRSSEWVAAARREWAVLRSRVPRAVIAGQSMGGALALILATDEPRPAAVVLLAPYLAMGRVSRALANVWPLWQLLVPRLGSDPRRSFRDPQARAQSRGNAVFTPRLVFELKKVVRLARRSLPNVRVPTLVLHARADYRIPSRSAQRSFDALGARDKALVWRDASGHVLAADAGREEVAILVGEWLDERVPPDRQR